MAADSKPVPTVDVLLWFDTEDSNFAFPPLGEITMNTEPPVKPGADGIYPVAVPGQTKLV